MPPSGASSTSSASGRAGSRICAGCLVVIFQLISPMTTEKPRSRRAPLNAEIVQAIRLCKSQGMKQSVIAARFGVSNAAVSLIVRGLRRREKP